ncbi:hypothetical protein DL770_007649 [Monosporascus sp. CRB-9-2]|nr:hypothetical protein DL770_007649 [Monosporascus sp. CRB-9-2]
MVAWRQRHGLNDVPQYLVLGNEWIMSATLFLSTWPGSTAHRSLHASRPPPPASAASLHPGAVVQPHFADVVSLAQARGPYEAVALNVGSGSRPGRWPQPARGHADGRNRGGSRGPDPERRLQGPGEVSGSREDNRNPPPSGAASPNAIQSRRPSLSVSWPVEAAFFREELALEILEHPLGKVVRSSAPKTELLQVITSLLDAREGKGGSDTARLQRIIRSHA